MDFPLFHCLFFFQAQNQKNMNDQQVWEHSENQCSWTKPLQKPQSQQGIAKRPPTKASGDLTSAKQTGSLESPWKGTASEPDWVTLPCTDTATISLISVTLSHAPAIPEQNRLFSTIPQHALPMIILTGAARSHSTDTNMIKGIAPSEWWHHLIPTNFTILHIKC